jgi:WD40 repeat protein
MRRPTSARRADRGPARPCAIAVAAALIAAACGPPGKPRVESTPPRAAPAFVAQAGHFAGVRDLSFGPGSDVIASVGGVDRSVNLWDADEGGLLTTLHEERSLEWTVAFRPAGDLVASGGTDGWIRLWDPERGDASIAAWRAHDDTVTDLAWDPQGERLVSVSGDGKVALWGPDGGAVGPPIVDRPAAAVAFAPDGELIAVGRTDGGIALLRPADGTLVGELRWLDAAVTALVFGPRGERLVASRADGSVQLWDPVSGELLLGLDGHRGAVYGVCFDPDGERIATVG